MADHMSVGPSPTSPRYSDAPKRRSSCVRRAFRGFTTTVSCKRTYPIGIRLGECAICEFTGRRKTIAEFKRYCVSSHTERTVRILRVVRNRGLIARCLTVDFDRSDGASGRKREHDAHKLVRPCAALFKDVREALAVDGLQRPRADRRCRCRRGVTTAGNHDTEQNDERLMSHIIPSQLVKAWPPNRPVSL